MNKVDVIKSIDDIHKIEEGLLRGDYKNYLMFLMGINTGIAINQLLALQVKNILKEDGTILNSLIINKNEYKLNDTVRESLKKYLSEHLEIIKNNSYLFSAHHTNIPMDQTHANMILNVVSNKAGINIRFGTHTLRKTYGYHFYQKHHDLKYLRKLYNHAADCITAEYIGIESTL